MIDCPELIEGCPDCEAESKYLESVGHECGRSNPRFVTACEAFGKMRRESAEYHKIAHQPERCSNCQAVLRDRLGEDGLMSGWCRSRCCTVWSCAACGAEYASAGPLDCPSCGSFGRPVNLTRIRASYRRRRRYW